MCVSLSLKDYNMQHIFGGLSASEKLARDKSGALFMKMGERKIKLAFSLILSKLDEIDYVVWIAPNACLSSSLRYRSLLKKYAQQLGNKFKTYSVESLSLSDIRYLSLYNLVDSYRVFCVVDDSLTIKNTEAGRTRRLLAIAPKFKYRLILSSMPLTQGLIDLYSQLKFMNPKLLPISETQFQNQYMPLYEDEFQTIKHWSTPENERILVEKMRPYIYDSEFDFACKIKKFDALFFLSDAEKRVYEDEKDRFLSEKYRFPFMEIVHKFQRIYTICESKVFGLFNLLSDVKLRREKAVVFVRFLDEIDFFRDCGWFEDNEYAVLTGAANKRKVLKLFENEVDILFASYGTNSFADWLPFCQNIIFFSQIFDYRLKVKMVHDIDKSAISHEVKIYDFWVDTGLDIMMRKNLFMKQVALDNVCNSIVQGDVCCYEKVS